jgi:hypothetical protein
MAGGVFIYWATLVLIASVFKPDFNDFRAAFRDHPANFRHFMGFESAIESHREIIQPDFTFVPGLEHMHMHPLGQVVAVKAHPITVMDEYGWHWENLSDDPEHPKQTKMSSCISPANFL